MEKQLRALRLVMTLATVLVLALLAWQCIAIYFEGNSPDNLDDFGVYLHPVYSVEIVRTHWVPIRPAVIGYVFLTLGALLLQALWPSTPPRFPIASRDRLRLMRARVRELPKEATALERQRRAIRLSAGGAVLICILFSLLYLLNRQNFTSWDLEMVMGQMLLHVGPWFAAAFAVALAAAFACDRSRNREIAVLKGHLGKPEEKTEASVHRRTPVGMVRTGVYAAAALFILLGVMNGGMRDVLVKAANICTECIGLG